MPTAENTKIRLGRGHIAAAQRLANRALLL